MYMTKRCLQRRSNLAAFMLGQRRQKEGQSDMSSGSLRSKIVRGLPSPLIRAVSAMLGRSSALPPGSIRFGDLRRTSPISIRFGFDRGTPIDRYYIEQFLMRYASDVRGHVLEVGDDLYTRQFGGVQVLSSDILNVDARNPRATIVGDISSSSVLPTAKFDCIILTQTLQLIFDLQGAIDFIYRALKPCGVLLLTVPGISQIDPGEWGPYWYWSFTRLSIRRLFEERFGAGNVQVVSYGNVFAAAAFLYGLAVEDVNPAELDVADTSYPVTIAARIIKS